MSDKENSETHIFERFVKLYKDLPPGVAVKTASPDFLMKGGGGIVGVEILVTHTFERCVGMLLPTAHALSVCKRL